MAQQHLERWCNPENAGDGIKMIDAGSLFGTSRWLAVWRRRNDLKTHQG